MACTFQSCRQGRRLDLCPPACPHHRASEQFWNPYADEDMRCDSTLSAVALAVFAAVTPGCGLMLILAAFGVLL